MQDGDSERLAELSELIEQLIGQGVLMAVPTSQLNVERELRFAYPPWQKTIYEQVESERKRRYHLLLAQFLQLQPVGARPFVEDAPSPIVSAKTCSCGLLGTASGPARVCWRRRRISERLSCR